MGKNDYLDLTGLQFLEKSLLIKPILFQYLLSMILYEVEILIRRRVNLLLWEWGETMIKSENIRDLITVEDEAGNEILYEVEALFDMRGETYALLRSENDTVLMQVEEDEDGQHLIGLSNHSEKEAILDAYEIAVDAAPADPQ
ncbi:DUF1292 domain-containing protein [Mesobacillus maritimus]|uniref:DUF1292 domain-containing protein n=1 Tax=Mesobacillus maritimus TaxID=1643336 RepID=UPI0032E7F686